MLALVAFVVYDMRHAALAYLGINPAKPAVEFEIRLPKAALTAAADTQIELRTDRNQKLAKVQEALASTPDGRSFEGNRDARLPHHRAGGRAQSPRRGQRQFRLRLPAALAFRSSGRGIWPTASCLQAATR